MSERMYDSCCWHDWLVMFSGWGLTKVQLRLIPNNVGNSIIILLGSFDNREYFITLILFGFERENEHTPLFI